MRMTVELLRNLDVGGLNTRADAVQALADRLRDRARDIASRSQALADWEGLASEGAKAEFRRHQHTFEDLADAVAPSAGVLRTAASRLRAARQRLEDALSEAASNDDLRVNKDGTIDYVGPHQSGYNPYNPGSFDPRMGETTAQGNRLAGQIHDALLEAERADGDASNELDRVGNDLRSFVPPAGDGTVAAAATSIPPAAAAPAEVKAWWDGLSPVQREASLFAHPDRLGRLDGVPVLARNRANLTLLADEQGELSAQREAAQRNLDYSRRVDPDGEHTQAASAHLAELDGKIRGLNAVVERVYQPQPGQQPAYLMGIDTTGTGRALVASGNPDKARNTLTYVPGTGSSLAASRGDIERSDLMIQAADKAANGDSGTAAVTWIGYDAPPEIPQAALGHYADNAEQSLASFQEGLQATHQGESSHNTVLGHSYGSTVIGHTARDNPDFAANVDEVVFVGSPGVGVQDANSLNLGPDQVHATVAQHDIIKLSNIDVPGIGDPHGPDPTKPEFGANVFTSKSGSEGPDATAGLHPKAHSEYWDPRNHSLINMGRIIVGKETY